MWASKLDDDWLAEEPVQNNQTQPQAGNIESQSLPLDLTVSVPLEPLHTLPEAPPCQLRMYFVVHSRNFHSLRRYI